MKRLLSVARRFTKPQANDIHALDEDGRRAPWQPPNPVPESSREHTVEEHRPNFGPN